ncbi:unnamed protein product [Natator depressus]
MNGARRSPAAYKRRYRALKRRLKLLIYEQECFQEELRKAQRKLLKVSRDKSFLLDRLLQHEHVDEESSGAGGGGDPPELGPLRCLPAPVLWPPRSRAGGVPDPLLTRSHSLHREQ